MTDHEYFVSLLENQTLGPMTYLQVRAMLFDGKINGLTWTWTKSSGDWQPFSSFHEFHADDLEQDAEESDSAFDPPPEAGVQAQLTSLSQLQERPDPQPVVEPTPAVEPGPEPAPVFVQGPPMATRPVLEIGRVKGQPEESLPPWEADQPAETEDRATAEDQPETGMHEPVDLGPAPGSENEESIELPPETADEAPLEIVSALSSSIDPDDDSTPAGGSDERSEYIESPSKADVRYITAELEVLSERDSMEAECSNCGTKVTRCPCCGEILVLAPVASRRSA